MIWTKSGERGCTARKVLC